MKHADFILVGGGLASATAAETLRAEGATGSILLLCAESIRPYHRPPLSKQGLLGIGSQAPSFIHSADFYREHSIDLRLNTRVIAIDCEERTVTTDSGEQIGYDRLLLATGATPRTPSLPGITLGGIHTLRSKNDADSIKRAAAEARRTAVLGGSFLGMEIASSLLARGLEVTIIEQSSSLLTRLEAPELSAYFRRHAELSGISVLLNDTACAVHGDGRVQEVETVGGRRLPCDLLIVSIGVGPASRFLDGCGIVVRDGWIVVDSLLRTSEANVFAAGDVTVFYDPVFARFRHIEHWDNAVKQGRLAARNMMERRLPYDEVSYFNCEFGDVGFNVLGATEEAGERIARGSMDEQSCAVFYLRGDVLRAFFSTGRPVDETRIAESWIRFRVNLHSVEGRLSEPAFALDRKPPQTALILQGGGALGAFECGVVKALEEERIFPDIVAGVSIGALNGAIIASHPRQAGEALEAFWNELIVITPDLWPVLNKDDAVAIQVLAYGVPKFFRPQWTPFLKSVPQLPLLWTSYYDTSPMRELITKYVDFSRLKSSPVRLLISAVNVETAELEIFDSFVDELTADHVIASGSLPPGFPWTMIADKAYWDGGIVSNSPLDLVVDRCGPDGKRVFVVDLFGGTRPLPSNMMEVLARRDEIVYSERVRNDFRYREAVEDYRKLLQEIIVLLDPAESAKLKRQPRYIQLMGNGAPTTITRLVRQGKLGERPSRDYDFSDDSISAKKSEGYAIAKRAIAAQRNSSNS